MDKSNMYKYYSEYISKASMLKELDRIQSLLPLVSGFLDGELDELTIQLAAKYKEVNNYD